MRLELMNKLERFGVRANQQMLTIINRAHGLIVYTSGPPTWQGRGFENSRRQARELKRVRGGQSCPACSDDSDFHRSLNMD